jgi:hypothetical protein
VRQGREPSEWQSVTSGVLTAEGTSHFTRREERSSCVYGIERVACGGAAGGHTERATPFPPRRAAARTCVGHAGNATHKGVEVNAAESLPDGAGLYRNSHCHSTGPLDGLALLRLAYSLLRMSILGMDSTLTTHSSSLAPVTVPARADLHPVAVYLARLAPGSRRAMRQALISGRIMRRE